MVYNNRNSNKTVSPKTSYSPIEQAILTTILYSDVFTSPVTEPELWKYLVSDKTISRKAFTNALNTLRAQPQGLIVFQDGYYCLRGHEKNISKRIQNLSEVTTKMLLAQRTVSRLASLPTISFIGLSGGLAVENVTAADDIDLFIIVKKGTLFRSRLWILLMLELMGVRRSRGAQKTANTICVNLLIDESELQWEAQNRDVYIAHEIAQVVPLFDRSTMFESFLGANQWIETYLPNVLKSQKHLPNKQLHTNKTRNVIGRFLSLLPFETLFRLFQISLIKRHQTREIVTKSQLAFHPKDYRADSLRQLKLKMQQLGLLTKC